MFYLDSHRSVTRRDSSLITTGRRHHVDDKVDFSDLPTARGQSTARLTDTDSLGSSCAPRPKGTTQREIVTMLFEAMLPHIVESWEVIETPQKSEGKGTSESAFMYSTTNKKNKKATDSKTLKVMKTRNTSRSKTNIDENQSDPVPLCWWNGPDEKAVINFKNGNVYEGNISMKLMNGEGRFQWASGITYLGEFKDNKIEGRGEIRWRDDSWYSGEFVNNLRHGKGLYVDSRRQRSYSGDWYCGTKHGKGTICYSHSNNYYDGDWVFNMRHGSGVRVYGPNSVYEGEWDQYVREGTGQMLWPNHDYYNGWWKNGVMCGYGLYIWNTMFNNSLAMLSMIIYRGNWYKGKRHGYGILNLGHNFGCHYKGEFKENRKHGMGKFVTINGQIIKDKKLFMEDNIRPIYPLENCSRVEICSNVTKHLPISHDHNSPISFELCDSSVGLRYHVEEAFNNLDNIAEIRAITINEFIENNIKIFDSKLELTSCEHIDKTLDITEDLIQFEVNALHRVLKGYGNDLKSIYYNYATICTTESLHITPVLIRLYLWQFYFDCDMHEKGLNLVEIDELFLRNREWLAETPHGPFEKVYLWQFLHSLLSIATRLYAKKTLPGPKPDTIVANAFRYFMEHDALPNSGRCKGYLPRFGTLVPLSPVYQLYRALGEPHTVRKFLAAVHATPEDMGEPQPEMVDASDDNLPTGRNAFVLGDNLIFRRDERFMLPCIEKEKEEFDMRDSVELFNFANLPSATIIKIMSEIFPFVSAEGTKATYVVDLEIRMTFFEFYQALMACCEESIRVENERREPTLCTTSLQ